MKKPLKCNVEPLETKKVCFSFRNCMLNNFPLC